MLKYDDAMADARLPRLHPLVRVHVSLVWEQKAFGCG